MSDARPDTPEELEMLAGEYVLGVLGSADLRAVGQKARFDPQLADAIAGWEQQLAPMLTAVQDVAPPEALWARIEYAKSLVQERGQDAKPAIRLAAAPSAAARPPAEPVRLRPAGTRRVWPWQASTAGAFALAAGLAIFMLLPSVGRRGAPVAGGAMLADATSPNAMAGGREVALVAVLAQPEMPGEPRQDSAPQMATDTGIGRLRLVEPPPDAPERVVAHMSGFIAATWPDGAVVLSAFAPVPVADGKALVLWAKPPGSAALKSLGVLSPGGTKLVLPGGPAAGTALSVTLEPAGGAPGAAPTGRVVYAGVLQQVRP